MNTHRFHSLIAVVVLLCFLIVAWSVPAEAQKKQKSKTPAKEQVKETPKDQSKEELKEEKEEAVSEPPMPGSLPNKFLDVLKQYVGKKTNLGTLKKFAGDYIIFEDELTTILVPMTSIQSAKLVKEEETSPAELEVKLFARD